ncbi:hypothetical protein HanPI659440_Chr13g0493731 [Helianthus annuus]|nr:hypothetical protein HanPI659440_Chr13g0493731 [Helianthus annuus]
MKPLPKGMAIFVHSNRYPKKTLIPRSTELWWKWIWIDQRGRGRGRGRGQWWN